MEHIKHDPTKKEVMDFEMPESGGTLEREDRSREAFEAIVKEKYKELYAICQGLVHPYGNRQSKIDRLFQEALIKAWLGFPNLRDLDSFEGWFNQIAKNLAVDFHRKFQASTSMLDKWPKSLTDERGHAVDAPSFKDNPEIEMIERDEALDLERKVGDFVENLTQRKTASTELKCEVFALSQQGGGLNNREIAARFNLSSKELYTMLLALEKKFNEFKNACKNPAEENLYDEFMFFLRSEAQNEIDTNRELFRLSIVDGLDSPALAKKLNMNYNTVKVKKMRLLAQFRRYLKTHKFKTESKNKNTAMQPE